MDLKNDRTFTPDNYTLINNQLLTLTPDEQNLINRAFVL